MSRRRPEDYSRSVFINCPFDDGYREMFQAIVFCVVRCGFKARCALEIDDGSQVRIDKIFRIIETCKFGIHDLSRTEIDTQTALPRFNMPLELGIFLGAKRYGTGFVRDKSALILDAETYRYQKFISDIAGQDVRAHERDVGKAIAGVRDWLQATKTGGHLPGPAEILSAHKLFNSDLPQICERAKLRMGELTFNDLTNAIYDWCVVEAQQADGIAPRPTN